MRRVRVSRVALAAGFAAAGALVAGLAEGATGEGETPQIAEARATGVAADLMLRYIQEDGPESGHVRVVLTPETRPLTVMEARMAARAGVSRSAEGARPRRQSEAHHRRRALDAGVASRSRRGRAGHRLPAQERADWSVFAGE